jgi:hypothetical protein
LIVEAARPRRHAAGSRWFVDETYVGSVALSGSEFDLPAGRRDPRRQRVRDRRKQRPVVVYKSWSFGLAT